MLAQGDKFTVTPTFHVFQMYLPHSGAQAVRAEFTAPSYLATRSPTRPFRSAATAIADRSTPVKTSRRPQRFGFHRDAGWQRQAVHPHAL